MPDPAADRSLAVLERIAAVLERIAADLRALREAFVPMPAEPPAVVPPPVAEPPPELPRRALSRAGPPAG